MKVVILVCFMLGKFVDSLMYQKKSDGQMTAWLGDHRCGTLASGQRGRVETCDAPGGVFRESHCPLD